MQIRRRIFVFFFVFLLSARYTETSDHFAIIVRRANWDRTSKFVVVRRIYRNSGELNRNLIESHIRMEMSPIIGFTASCSFATTNRAKMYSVYLFICRDSYLYKYRVLLKNKCKFSGVRKIKKNYVDFKYYSLLKFVHIFQLHFIHMYICS